MVRVVNIAEGYSLEFCGGSHVQQTGEIGTFRITQETSSASGVRRIEALTGMHAFEKQRAEKETFEAMKQKLLIGEERDALEGVDAFLENYQSLKKECQNFLVTLTKNGMDMVLEKKMGELIFFEKSFEKADVECLRGRIAVLRNRPNVVVFISVLQGNAKVNFLCGVSENLQGSVKANELVKEASALCDGGGGGRSDYAQAGGKNISKLKEAHLKIEGILKQKFST